MTSARPLEGLTVVEIGHSIAAPYAGFILSDLGAEVIKIEQPEGDAARGWGPPFHGDSATVFHLINRGKVSVTLDLSNPTDRQRASALIIQRADVVLQNLKFGALDRLGLNRDALLAEKPSLIWCDVGAYGATGPLRDKPGYDPLMQAVGGLMSVSGEPGGEPVRVTVSIVDMGAGLWSTIGILASVVERAKTGRGGVVSTSLYETAIAWMGVPITAYLASGALPEKTGSANAQIAPYQAFPTRDGHLMVAAGNDRLFHKLCAALQRGDLADNSKYQTNAGRVTHRHDLAQQLTQTFSERSSQYWIAALESAGIPCGPIRSVDQVVDDPQTKALGIVQAPPGDGPSLVALPLSFDGVRPEYRALAPPRTAPAGGEV